MKRNKRKVFSDFSDYINDNIRQKNRNKNISVKDPDVESHRYYIFKLCGVDSFDGNFYSIIKDFKAGTAVKSTEDVEGGRTIHKVMIPKIQQNQMSENVQENTVTDVCEKPKLESFLISGIVMLLTVVVGFVCTDANDWKILPFL
ncbi:hypothetical protein OAB94_02185 [Flavobacteriaceae bacterium]|nr:hypothetical protein [Flavobacteriaceae bacterium]